MYPLADDELNVARPGLRKLRETSKTYNSGLTGYALGKKEEKVKEQRQWDDVDYEKPKNLLSRYVTISIEALINFDRIAPPFIELNRT